MKPQLDVLADYIMAQIPGEPSRNEGAGDCAVRLMKEYRDSFRAIMNTLGPTQPEYPAWLANAYKIAKEALG